MKNKKFFCTLAARVLVIVLIFAGAACMAAGAFLFGRVLNTGVTFTEALQRVEYVKSRYVTTRVSSDAVGRLQEELEKNRFTVNGSYDLSQTVDITNLGAGISAANKSDATTYTLEDLLAFYQDKPALNGLQSVLERSDEGESFGNDVLTEIENQYDIDIFYVSKSGNLYGTAYTADEFTSSAEVLDYIENIDSETRFYKISGDGTVERFQEGDDTGVNLVWISEAEARGRLSVNLDEVEWDQNSPFDYSDYGDTFWTLYANGKQYETVLPRSGETLADYALKHPDHVSIMDCYKELINAAVAVGDTLEGDSSGQQAVQETTQPLGYYWFHDMETDAVYTNNPDWKGRSYEELESLLSANYDIPAGGCTATASGTDTTTNTWISAALDGEAKNTMENRLSEQITLNWDEEAVMYDYGYVWNEQRNYQLVIAMNEEMLSYPENAVYFENDAYEYAESVNYMMQGLILMIAGLIVTVIFFIISVIQAGRRNETKERYASAFARNIPIEILLAVDIVCWVIYGCVVAALTQVFVYNAHYGYWDSDMASYVIAAVAILGFVALTVWQTLTLVCKGKSRNMRTNSLIGRFGGGVVKACKNAYHNRKITGKLVICFAVFIVINIIGIALCGIGIGVLILIVVWAATLVILMKKCVQRQRVKDGIHEIAGGNLDYQIDAANLTGDELNMAKDLNNVREGMQNAIQEQMKSERLKTDLITNVSHDIKTPLTSIINYVDILKKENIQDEKIRGYIDILDKKSQRLKHLTEDLVEASKISSGNIKLDIQEINLKQLLKQTNGEFEEKFEKKNLTLVCNLPENQMLIRADGRRMWRVIENLYNNAAKYAMPNSRVYVDGGFKNGKIVVTIKNISEYPLNISADELMERFVRGDVSRNTEGSGLGLEIARNLTVMQKGTFDIYLDGDLFKVIITFDAI